MSIRHPISEFATRLAFSAADVMRGAPHAVRARAARALQDADRLLPVVIQGGITSDSHMYEAQRRWFVEQGYKVYVTRLPWHGMASIERDAAELAKTVEQALRETGAEQANIVAHSKGGISARYYLQRLDGLERVHNLVTLGTPHQGVKPPGGAVAARIGAMLPGVGVGKRLIAGSDLLRDLNGDLGAFLERAVSRNAGLRLTSISGGVLGLQSDGLIPWWSSRLPNHRLLRNMFVTQGHASHLELPVRSDEVRQILASIFGSARDARSGAMALANGG